MDASLLDDARDYNIQVLNAMSDDRHTNVYFDESKKMRLKTKNEAPLCLSW
jgi:hypothetical protein